MGFVDICVICYSELIVVRGGNGWFSFFVCEQHAQVQKEDCNLQIGAAWCQCLLVWSVAGEERSTFCFRELRLFHATLVACVASDDQQALVVGKRMLFFFPFFVFDLFLYFEGNKVR